MRTVSDRYELVREGRFCESRASLIRAYVAGIAGPNRAREARDHLATCPACRRFAIDLRDATGRFAALLPLPAVGLDRPGWLAHVAELLGGGRDGATHATTQAKEQLALLTTRVDPASASVVGGMRPGAVAAAVAGCLALSGGAATYCAVVGVPPPLRDAVGVHVSAAHPQAKQARKPKAQTTPVTPSAATSPTVTTTAARTPAPAVTHTTTTSARATKAAKAHAAAARKAAAKRRSEATTSQEFGFEGAGEPAQNGATAQAASQTPATTSKAASTTTTATPKDAPTEFDP
jgi:hypothetical protein